MLGRWGLIRVEDAGDLGFSFGVRVQGSNHVGTLGLGV